MRNKDFGWTKKTRRAVVTASALLFTSIGFGFTASPAHADVVQGCTSGDVCFYDTSVSANPFEAREYADSPIGELHSIAPATSWVRNRSSKQWWVYKTSNCSGAHSVLYANTTGAMNAEWNNVIRCYKRVS